VIWLLMACTNPCDEAGALAECVEPTESAETYAELSSWYFDTMDYTVDHEGWPPYSETVARWEWPPWLLLTAYGRENIEATDTLLVLLPSVVPERDCRGFDTQPFGRCKVTFYYDKDDGKGCPIYEEFTFNDAGEITFIEAWSDVPGLTPVSDADPWGEASDIGRLSARIPGLGAPGAVLDVNGPDMTAAAQTDPDVAEFVYRANDWVGTWSELAAESGDEMWIEGCGWE
jgi:hypothetical protein